MRVKVAGGLEAIAGRATGNEHGVHGDSFSEVHLLVDPHLPADYYGGGDPDFLQRGVHISFVIVQPLPSSPAKAAFGPAGPYERPTHGSHRAASAACRVLEAEQRRRPLGLSLLGLRPAELLRGARGQLPVDRRWPPPPDSGSG